MNLQLDYGKSGLWADLPDDRVCAVMRLGRAEPLEDPQRAVIEALHRPIGSPGLAELARGRRTACVVISDITRPVPNRVILPPLLSTLESNGLWREDITILVGTGLHRPSTEDELISMVGEEIVRSYRIVVHKARERETLTCLGQTSSGVPIWVDAAYMAADLRIATALIEPHLMAGYSGGRKAICPGICGVDTIRAFHGFAILSSPYAIEGVIEGNPVHRFSLEVARRARVDFILNVAMDEARHVTGVFAGDLEQAHEAGMRFVERQARATIPEPAEVVVTTSAGYPLDLTFYQAVKGLTAALPAVKEGGTIVLAARCAEGIGGPEFTRLLRETPGPEAFAARFCNPDEFVIDQWQVQELCKVLQRARVSLYSEGVEPTLARELMVEPVPSVEDGVAQALSGHGPAAKIAVIPKGPYVLARVG